MVFHTSTKNSPTVLGEIGPYKHTVFIMTAVALLFILKFKEAWIFGMHLDSAQNATDCAKQELMFLQ